MAVLTLMSWKTTAALLLGLAAQGCGFSDFYKDRFERQAEQHLARVAERMSYHEELRNLAYYPQEDTLFEDDKQYEHTAKKVFKNVGQAALKAGWKSLTENTSIDGIIEPSFKEDDENRIPTFSEPAVPEQRKSHSRYKLGFMPVVRVGDEVGGGIKVRNASLLAVRGDDYWEYKAHAHIAGIRLAGEYVDDDIEKNKYKFGIGRGPFAFSYSQDSEEKTVWIEFFK